MNCHIVATMAARYPGKCGYINTDSDLVVPPEYNRASDSWNGMAEVVQKFTRLSAPLGCLFF